MGQARRKEDPSAGPSRIERHLREAAFMVAAAAALFLLLALASYHTADSAWSYRAAGEDIHNLGGRLGAFLADVLYALFGYLAWLFPIALAFGAGRIFATRSEATGSRRDRVVPAIGLILAVLGGCGIAALHFPVVGSPTHFASGGWIGNAVGSGLVYGASFTGATVFLLAMLLSGTTLFAGISWLRVMDVTGRVTAELGQRGFGHAGDALAGAWKAWRERRASVVPESPPPKAQKRRAPALDESRPERIDAPQPAPRIEIPAAPVAESKRARKDKEAAKQPTLFPGLAPSDALPPLSLLDEATPRTEAQFTRQSLEEMARLLERKLGEFGVEAKVNAVAPGPVVTLFEIEPAPGVKASQITNLSRDLARALSVQSLRVVENLPGKSTMGIEIPNDNREIVRLHDLLASKVWDDIKSPVALALGKDISGQPIVADLARMPHLLIAGTTGSGKSVCINALVLSLVYKAPADQVRLIMVDPKMLELAVYEGIPHLLAPVVTDMKQAANALKWAIFEMERRYRLMAALGVRNLAGFNRKVRDARDAGNPVLDPLIKPGETPAPLDPLPMIVIIVDELADLMMVVGKKVEELIARLAQKARASGIHLVLATQRPSVDVVTGLIKANIPTRVAFQMSSRVDSRTVLDQMGAESLLGQGDMLFLVPGQGQPQRVHGAFISDQEVHKVVEYLKSSGSPTYDERILTEDTGVQDNGVWKEGGDEEGDGESDPLYDEALRIVTETRRASISGVQRRLRIGYNRAARLIEQMERSGVVGPLQTNGNREVLAPPPPGGD